MVMSGVTIVTTISCHVLYFQGPFPLRILVPRVGGHKGPVVESLGGEVIGPDTKERRERFVFVFLCGFFSCLRAGDSRDWGDYIFGLSIGPILVNTISQECLEGISLNLPQMSTWTLQ